jgi:pyruvate,water dikinase
MVERMAKTYRIPHDPEEKPLEDLIIFRGARMYVAYSDMLWFFSPQRLAGQYEIMDVLLYRTLDNLDRSSYRPKDKPGWLAWNRIARSIFGTLFGSRRLWWNTAAALLSPARYLQRFRQAGERFESEARSASAGASIAELHDLHGRSMDLIMNIDLAPIFAWLAAIRILERLARGADPQTRELLDRMGRGFEGELVIEMGVEMFATSRLLDPSEFDDLERLAKRLEARKLPAAFLAAWDAFIDRFGARAPNEMELASPRYGEDPLLLLRQLSFMAKAAPENDPKLAHECHVVERREAFAELSRRYGWFSRTLLRFANNWTEAFAGERDTAKYHWVLATYAMRRSALARAERLTAAGRIDSPEDVFHLTFDELEAAERDAKFDVRTLALERRRFHSNLTKQVKEFPHLIDSRGRILRPAPMDEKGALSGLGISPGIARGPIKVLENPYDKDIEPGDVLVAYTTDPGWTPLFINASAIILQIGGMMQHGGVVAREYGKPCVAGIEHVLTRFQDGQMVEVDGSAGVVRPLG